MGGPRPLLLLLGAVLVTDHVTGQTLQLTPNRSEYVKFANKSLFVSCKGRNAVQIRWLGPNDKVIDQQTGPVRVEASSPTDGLNGVDLLLNPVKRKDRGRYECKAEIDGRLRTASFELTVLQPIEFRDDQRVQFAVVEQDFVLRCDATGEPKPTVSWRGVGQQLEMGPNKKFDIDPETKGLVIRHVSRQDEGKYRCKATQVNTQDSDLKVTDIELKVLYGPEWSGQQQTDAFGFLGGSVNLSCQADAEPPPTFSWFHEDQPVQFQPVDTDYRSVLQITSLEDRMFGNYKCVARNQHNQGGISRTIVLRKVMKPAVPQVSVTKTESSRLTLSITTAPEEDPADSYRAEYRTTDAAWTSATAVQFQPGSSHVLSNLRPGTVYVIRVASENRGGRGEFSAGLRQKTAAAATRDPAPPNSSQPLVLSLLVSLLMAALLVL